MQPLPTEPQRTEVSAWFSNLQQRICHMLEALETESPALMPLVTCTAPGQFAWRPWQRGEDGGGGTSGLMTGRVFEKAGVNVSTVYGEFSEEFCRHVPGAQDDPRFWASGISLVIHPWSPWVPTIHMNTRLIMTTTHWFGGGIDLTPMHTPDAAQTAAFHDCIKTTCDAHDVTFYPRFKQWCDEYFYLPHRQEPRGVGGIFYDTHTSGDWAQDVAFTQDVGEIILKIYPQLVRENWDKPWGEAERAHQLQRRGRYVEFNLLYDRGTLFGLKTGGNIDAILMSLPPQVSWAG
jgi:coproporphyrinogen III oxidase